MWWGIQVVGDSSGEGIHVMGDSCGEGIYPRWSAKHSPVSFLLNRNHRVYGCCATERG